MHLFANHLIASSLVLAPLTALATVGSPSIEPAPAPQGFPLLGGTSPWIANQSGTCQEDAWFQVRQSLPAGKAVGEIKWSNASDSITTYGLWAHADGHDRKGSQIGVQANTSITAPVNHPQEGNATGRLAQVTGFDSGGSFLGATATGEAKTLNNFGSGNTSQALGASFVGRPTSGDTLSLDGTGRYLVGGVRGELQGRVDGNPGTGAVAGVIGIDNADASSTAPHWAGYFQGNMRTTGSSVVNNDLFVDGGNIVLDSASNPGRIMELQSHGRQEIHCTNDLVVHGGGNIEMRPGANGGNDSLFVANGAGTKFVSMLTTAQQMVVGGTSPTGANMLTVLGDVCAANYNSCSSLRWKENVEELEDGLETVLSLRGVRYDWKDSGETDIGVIAEEVAAVMPEVVSYEDDGETPIGVDYSRLTAVLIEAVKDQQEQIDTLREMLENRE